VSVYTDRGPRKSPAPASSPRVIGEASVTAILVDVDGRCGCCSGLGEHPCGHECSSCDGAGRDPDKPVCAARHGADCTCAEPAPPLPADGATTTPTL
jgi:hypothetical protein